MSHKSASKSPRIRGLGGTIVRSAIGSFGLRILNKALSFFVSIFLTRILGVEGYGIYAYSMSWVSILNLIGSLGSRGLVVREVAANCKLENWGLVQGFLRWSYSLVLATSVGVSAIFALLIYFFPIAIDAKSSMAIFIALFLVPITTLTILRQSTMQGLGHILKGQIPESILQPLFFIIFLASLYFSSIESVGITWVMASKVISSAFAFALGTFLLYRVLPNPLRQSSPEYEVKRWIPSMLSLFFIAGTSIIYTRCDVVMLGMMSGTGAVGLYAIALRLANFVLMSQQVGASVLGPHVASLYAQRNVERLQSLTTKSTRAVMAYALPLTLGLTILSHWALSIFGSEFVEGKNILIILCISKLLTVAVGPVGLLLTMTNYERANAVVVAVGALLNFGLNFVLIPPLGPEGAAIATGITSIAANVSLAFIVYRRLGINSTILSW